MALNWRGIDRDYAIAVRRQAHLLKQALPPVRVTAAAIERCLRGRDWLAKHRTKMPASVRAMNEVAEDTEAFQVRRMRWHVRECFSKGLTDPWVVMRIAGLPPRYIDAVRAELATEMARRVPLAQAI